MGAGRARRQDRGRRGGIAGASPVAAGRAFDPPVVGARRGHETVTTTPRQAGRGSARITGGIACASSLAGRTISGVAPLNDAARGDVVGRVAANISVARRRVAGTVAASRGGVNDSAGEAASRAVMTTIPAAT